MSLQTDIIFFNALAANTDLMQTVGNRLFNPADEDGGEFGENTPVPYLIITFDSLQNDQGTKDGYEGTTDMVQVSVEIAATCREELAQIAETVRTTIREYIETADETREDFDLTPYDYNLTAGPVQFDWTKPCVWQTITYQCDVKR